MQSLNGIIAKYGKDTDKMRYERVYQQYFRGRKPPRKVLEIGVNKGASLMVWKEWFKAKVFGIDNDLAKLEYEPGKVFQGDQTDRKFLRRVMSEIGSVDLIIDDGGHKMKQQIISFQELWPYLNKGGIYVIEDLITSSMPEYIDLPFTTVDYLLKEVKLIAEGLKAESITFFRNICLIEK